MKKNCEKCLADLEKYIRKIQQCENKIAEQKDLIEKLQGTIHHQKKEYAMLIEINDRLCEEKKKLQNRLQKIEKNTGDENAE